MTSTVSMFFSTEDYNGTMGMKISVGEKTIKQYQNVPAEDYEITFDVNWPSEIILDFYGKGPKDTKIDDQGNILQDKHILLKNFTIDRVNVTHDMIMAHKIINFDHGLIEHTNYFGFNGTAKILLNYKNSFHWLLKYTN